MTGLPAFAQATVTFAGHGIGYGNNYGYTVDQTDDGGYIIGALDNGGHVRYGMSLLKTDSLGDTSGFGLSPTLTRVAAVPVVRPTAGMQSSARKARHVAFLRKTDGPRRHRLTYLAAFAGDPQSIISCRDSGYAVVGRIIAPDSTEVLGLVKLDSLGHEQWVRSYPTGQYPPPWGRSVIQTADGGYFVCGEVSDSSVSRITRFARIRRATPSGRELFGGRGMAVCLGCGRDG